MLPHQRYVCIKPCYTNVDEDPTIAVGSRWVVSDESTDEQIRLISEDKPIVRLVGPTTFAQHFEPTPHMEGLLPNDPLPLYFQVPLVYLSAALQSENSELDPTMLCFEDFYQAVAAVVPRSMAIVDIGGYQGVQGWLFSDFDSYLDVDCYDLPGRTDHTPPKRCTLPSGCRHCCMDGDSWLDLFTENLAKHPCLADKVCVISAGVPNDGLRQRIARQCPNSIVYYPFEPLIGSGPYLPKVTERFNELNTNYAYAVRRENVIRKRIGLKLLPTSQDSLEKNVPDLRPIG